MHKYILTIGFSFFTFIANCQLLDSSVSISSLETPDAPGFILADEAPNAVSKPITPKAFGISIYSLLKGGAFQITPFWLLQHPKYDFERYVNNKFPLLETFNLSIATFKKDSSSVVSAGFKTHLFRLYQAKTKKEILVLKESAVKVLSNLDSNNEAVIKKALEEIKVNIDELSKKPLIRIELLGAYLGNSNTNSFKNLQASKIGAWLNGSYQPKDIDFSFTALGRYSKVVGASAKLNTDSIFVDYGIATSYTKNNFDITVEFVNRKDFISKINSNRLVAVLNYKVTDQITFVGSFGKNYSKVDDIFSVFGIKFGVSSKRIPINDKK